MWFNNSEVKEVIEIPAPMIKTQKAFVYLNGVVKEYSGFDNCYCGDGYYELTWKNGMEVNIPIQFSILEVSE